MKGIHCLFALLVVTAVTTARAQSFAAMLDRGNQAFYSADYAAAANAYEAIVEAGVDDVDVHYNLGVSHARAGAHGRAVLAFERALRVDPGDEAVRRALDASRQLVAERHAAREGESIVEAGATFGDTVLGFLSVDALALVVLVCAWAALLAFGVLLFARHDRVRLVAGVALPLTLLASIALGVGWMSRRGMFQPGGSAIVLADDAPLREGPRHDATTRGRTREGERARVLLRDGEWARVRIGAGEGWLPADAVADL